MNDYLRPGSRVRSISWVRRLGARPAAVLTVAAVVMLTGCAAGSSIAAPGPSVGQQVDAALPATVTGVPLVSSTGERFTLASLNKIVVLSDVMTLCQETCPLDTANVVAAARAVQRAGLADKIQFVSLTIDPTRDTPTRLAAYRRLYAPAPADWTIATGSAPTLHQLWKQLGVYIQRVPDTPPAPKDWLTGKPLTYDLTHSDELFFLDPRGHERFLLEGTPHVAPGAPLPAKISRFLDTKGRHNLVHADPFAWTLSDELNVLSWLTGHRIATPTS